jgi:hypothetical protein
MNNPQSGLYEMAVLPKKNENNSAAFKKIAPQMYLTENYLPSKVDNFIETVFFRYNIYKDEMEFTKDGKVVFLRKQKGRKILFVNTSDSHELFEFEEKLNYFVVHNEGKNQLLSKQVVKYKKEKIARNSYENSKAAKFVRIKDGIYIKFNADGIQEVPSNKNKFYDLFGKNAKSIKKFVKTNKLNIKNIDELEKIVLYLNTI